MARTSWREVLAPYSRASVARSMLDILTSVVPYFALSAAMYFALDASYWLVLLLALPAAGFLMRVYILFHDCTHGSFMPTKRGNQLLGMFFGLIVFSPFYSWRHNHAVHHATAGDLDRRGVGDVPTKTIREYYAMDWKGRFGYRAFRNPLVMFGVGPIWAMIIGPRFVSKDMRPRIRRSVIATNFALVAYVGFFCWLMGPKEFLLVQGPTAWIAGALGVFHDVPTLTLWDGVKTARLKLWDEDRMRLVGWAEARNGRQ